MMSGVSKCRPRIGLAMGDAAGIGPEIILKTLADRSVYARCRPIVLGSHEVMDLARQMFDVPPEVVAVDRVDEPLLREGQVRVLECTVDRNPSHRWGVVDALNGRNSIAALRTGIELAAEGVLDALVLGPFNKEAMHRAGSNHLDEFGLMAELARVPRVKGVVKWGPVCRSTVVGHVPFREIVDRLTVDEVVTTIEFLGATIESFGIPDRVPRPRIGVAALNPHGGEDGQFGDEEQRVLEPAIRAAEKLLYDVSGPYPADTIWHRAVTTQSLDGIVYLYHDQGNIAMKAAAFGEGVLIYAGLPYPVMAPGHGTAYDIAGQGRADHANFNRALDLAIEVCAEKRY